MVAVRLQLSGLVSRWDDDGVGEDQQLQAVVVSAASPEALKTQVNNIIDELSKTLWAVATENE